jgi:3-hydroxyacyl-CoA dehydrogenase/enoyl-CoA hydratase/3-hydroxybutyryl-CoA epimerase
MSSIHSEVLETGVHVLTFDRPDSAANIFDAATLTELNEKLDAVEQGARGVVFISAKPAIFIAGADLHALETLGGDDLRDFIDLGQQVFNRIASLRIPSVAAIHGACVGGGYELCLACQWRIATGDHATKIGLPETQLGILPAWGGSTRLPRLVGVPRALDIILGGKTLPAKAALRRGMIDDIAPRELLLQAALQWIRDHGRKPRPPRSQAFDRIAAAIATPIARRRMEAKSRGHYPALPKALDAVTLGAVETVEDSLRREHAFVIELAATPECRNLIRVFHLQERSRKLRVPGAPGTANLPIGLPPPTPAKPGQSPPAIAHVAVIGAGVMGSAIAQWLSARGLRVLMRDIDPQRVAAGMSRIAALYKSAVKRRIIDRREARDGMDRISPAATETPLDTVDLIIEAAVEKMDLKKSIFTRLDELAPPHTLLATNTSALSITKLGAAVRRPDRVIGIHFFNPVHRMPLVEVITGEKTSPETAATAVRFVQKIGKMPVLVRDSPGFLVNRILLPYLVEAGDLFAQGASIGEVDAAMLDFGMPMGPLQLIDEVGLDVAEDVAATLAASFPDHMHVPAVVGRMLAAKLLGKKSGRGFYIHEKGKVVPNPGAAKYRDPAATAALDRVTMQWRMALLMVNEAARCIEEKVVAEPADVDFGMIMGAGFAPFRGGPLRYADTLGPAAVTAALRDEAARSGAHFTPCQLLQDMTQTNRRFYAGS